MIWSMSYHFNNSELNFNDQNICRSILKFTVFLLSFWWYSVRHFEVPQAVFFKLASKPGALQSSCSWLKTTGRKIEIVKINTGVLRINVKLMWQVLQIFLCNKSHKQRKFQCCGKPEMCHVYSIFCICMAGTACISSKFYWF